VVGEDPAFVRSIDGRSLVNLQVVWGGRDGSVRPPCCEKLLVGSSLVGPELATWTWSRRRNRRAMIDSKVI